MRSLTPKGVGKIFLRGQGGRGRIVFGSAEGGQNFFACAKRGPEKSTTDDHDVPIDNPPLFPSIMIAAPLTPKIINNEQFLNYHFTVTKIKLVIDRDGATCRNNNHFERPTILNAPSDEHSNIGQTVQTGELGQTHKLHKQTDATKRIRLTPLLRGR